MVITFAELVQRWPSKTEEDILRMAIAGVLPLAIWYEGATKGHTKVNARNGGLLAMLPPAMAGTLLTKGKAEALKLTTEAGVEFMPAQYFYPHGDKFPSVQTVFDPATGTLITKTEESKTYPIRLPIKKTEIVIPLRAVEQLEAKYPELVAIKSNGKTTNSTDPRMERTDLHIIGGLVELLLGVHEEGEPCFKSQAKIIEAIVERCKGLPGITKRTLEDRFSAANKAISEIE